MTSYFAYGANMDPVHMAECCPQAKRLGIATLPGRSFRIAAKGYGDAAPAVGGELRGVLWELSPSDEVALDGFEGVPEGHYRKEYVSVLEGGGREVAAMLYRAADSAPGRPVPGYLERILAVAQELEFPAEYLESLRRSAIAG